MVMEPGDMTTHAQFRGAAAAVAVVALVGRQKGGAQAARALRHAVVHQRRRVCLRRAKFCPKRAAVVPSARSTNPSPNRAIRRYRTPDDAARGTEEAVLRHISLLSIVCRCWRTYMPMLLIIRI